MRKLVTTLVIIIILVIIFFAMGPFYIVLEGYQSVVTRFGEIISSTQEAGLKYKMPLVDNVVRYPKKILSWDGDPQRVPTKENQFIWVDTTARWKITEPELFYASVTSIDQAYSRLDDVMDSAVRTVIAENFLREAVRDSNVINEIAGRRTELAETENSNSELVGLQEITNFTITSVNQVNVEKGRRALSEEMLKSARKVTPDYGIELLDIVIRQIRYSDDLTESVYNRMIKERNQIAQAYRSFGEGKKKEWLGKQENEEKAILSKAYEQSETIKGTADATASKIYADAYNQDPSFFEFWKAIESYRTVLPKFSKTLTTDMDYFKYLYSAEGN